MTDYLQEAMLLLGKGKSPNAWLNAFYPEKASVVSQVPGATVHDLNYHSYRKWLGLLPDILERCRLVTMGGGLYEKKVVLGKIYTGDVAITHVSAMSCTLCWAYSRNGDCTKCPVLMERNEVKCYQLTEGELVSPWNMWTRDRNPLPMLESLEKAMEYAKRHPEMYQGVQYQALSDDQ